MQDSMRHYAVVRYLHAYKMAWPAPWPWCEGPRGQPVDDIKYLTGALLALNKLHKLGIVHRDIRFNDLRIWNGKVCISNYQYASATKYENKSLIPRCPTPGTSRQYDVWCLGVAFIEICYPDFVIGDWDTWESRIMALKGGPELTVLQHMIHLNPRLRINVEFALKLLDTKPRKILRICPSLKYITRCSNMFLYLERHMPKYTYAPFNCSTMYANTYMWIVKSLKVINDHIKRSIIADYLTWIINNDEGDYNSSIKSKYLSKYGIELTLLNIISELK
jgi:serine/threonine protein kinase